MTIDFTDAVIRHDTLHVEMKMRGGSLILVVGPGIVVDADFLATRYTDVIIHPPTEPDTPVRLRIHLAGRMRYGYIEARGRPTPRTDVTGLSNPPEIITTWPRT